MIKIRAELWPYGDEFNALIIGEIDIVNDGTGTAEYGNYEITFRNENENRRVRLFQYWRPNGYLGLLRLALNELHAGNYERD